MNALAGDDIAIVTDIAGTTRDTVREEMSSTACRCISSTPPAARHRRRGGKNRHEHLAVVERADVALVLVDSRDGIVPEVEAILAKLPPRLPRVHVFNKVDLSGDQVGRSEEDGHPVVRLSARTHAGVDDLRALLLEMIGYQGDSEGVFLARERHLDAIARAAITSTSPRRTGSRWICRGLRMAQNALSEITGRFPPTTCSASSFSRFCTGK
jgi:tRNA modification GTPase